MQTSSKLWRSEETEKIVRGDWQKWKQKEGKEENIEDRTEQEINNRKELVALGDLYFENVTETFYSKVLYPSWASR